MSYSETWKFLLICSNFFCRFLLIFFPLDPNPESQNVADPTDLIIYKNTNLNAQVPDKYTSNLRTTPRHPPATQIFKNL